MNPAVGVTALGRRDFLKLSAGSAALLSAGAFSAGLAGCSHEEPPAAGYRFLRAPDIKLFVALAPVILDAGLPAENRAACLDALAKGIDGGCALLQAPLQKTLRQLFDLLNTGLTRRLTTGVSQPWEQASEAEMRAFLQRWESSSLGLFNSGYRALTKLVVATWYAGPVGLAAVGYPGPWAPMYAAVNAA